MTTYVCPSHLFSGPCSKPPSKYLPEEKKNRSTCSGRCIGGILQILYFSPKIQWHPGPNQGHAARSILDKDWMFTRRKAGTGKKIAFSHMIKINSVLRGKISGGNKAEGQSGGGGGKEGEDATRQVTWSRAPSPFGCDPGHPVKSFDISSLDARVFAPWQQ